MHSESSRWPSAVGTSINIEVYDTTWAWENASIDPATTCVNPLTPIIQVSATITKKRACSANGSSHTRSAEACPQRFRAEAQPWTAGPPPQPCHICGSGGSAAAQKRKNRGQRILREQLLASRNDNDEFCPGRIPSTIRRPKPEHARAGELRFSSSSPSRRTASYTTRAVVELCSSASRNSGSLRFSRVARFSLEGLAGAADRFPHHWRPPICTAYRRPDE